jgi:hypothetical protein
MAARVYWAVYGPTVREMRQEQEDPTFYEDFERLERLVADMSGERGMPPPTRDQLRRVVEDETVIGQERPLLRSEANRRSATSQLLRTAFGRSSKNTSSMHSLR